MDDLISRQEAIKSLGDEPEVWTDKDEYAMGLNNQWHYDRNAILRCPSAQPSAQPDSPELDKLFGELKEKYEWAKQQEWILKPLGYALYYVWKEYDERGELL